MAAALFIVLIPRKEHEEVLRKIDKNITNILERKNIYSNATHKVLVENIQEKYNLLLSKYKSTDHLADSPTSLYKCNVDSSAVDEYNSYVKSPWDELKQAIRPNSNKLKITTPHRGCDVVLAFEPDTPLETVLLEVFKRLDVKNATWNPTKNNDFFQVIFSLESSTVSEEMLLVLRSLGFGSRYQSSVSVIPCTLYYKNSNDTRSQLPDEISDAPINLNDTAWTRFASSVRARTNLAQVLHDVRSDAALTFDWLFLLTVAAFVSAIGLVENSTVILVASMLISPLMGPITAGTLGTAVRDRSLLSLGLYNELLGLFLSLTIGFVFGLVICVVDERYGLGNWPTAEMMSRCEIRSLWIGVLVAIPSGAGVALAVLGEYTSSLVGVAISASLLPPAVNAGLLWAMSLLIFLADENNCCTVIKSQMYSLNPAIELATLGSVSLCLTLVNIVCIFLAGVFVYKVKEVSPMERREISWWRANRHLIQASNLNNHGHVIPSTWDKVKYSRWNKHAMENQDNVQNESEKINNVCHIHHDQTAHSIPKFQNMNLKTSSENESINERKLSFDEIKEDNFDSDSSLSDQMEEFYKRCQLQRQSVDNIETTPTFPVIEVSSNKTVDVGNMYISQKSYQV